MSNWSSSKFDISNLTKSFALYCLNLWSIPTRTSPNFCSILPVNMRYFVQCISVVLATLATICISTWTFALAIIPIFLCYYYTLVSPTMIFSKF